MKIRLDAPVSIYFNKDNPFLLRGFTERILHRTAGISDSVASCFLRPVQMPQCGIRKGFKYIGTYSIGAAYGQGTLRVTTRASC